MLTVSNNYPGEILNAAKAFLTESRETHKKLFTPDVPGEEFLLLWEKYLRYMRATVVHSVMAVEAFFNNKADEFIVRDQPEKLIVEHLNEKQSYINERGNFVTKEKHVQLTSKIKSFTKLITGKNFDFGDGDWKNFKQILDLRNGITHFKTIDRDADIDPYSMNIEIPEQAVDSSKAIIKKFYKYKNETVPEWVDQEFQPMLISNYSFSRFALSKDILSSDSDKNLNLVRAYFQHLEPVFSGEIPEKFAEDFEEFREFMNPKSANNPNLRKISMEISDKEADRWIKLIQDIAYDIGAWR